MAIVETFGKCKCGEFNAMEAVACHSCGARLPWAKAGRSSARSSSSTGGYGSPAARAAAGVAGAQAGYWDTALTGQSSPTSRPNYYGATAAASTNDPDIDFTPFGSSAGGSVKSGGAGNASFFCTHCGTGLSAGQKVCHSCRRLTTFTRADLGFTMMVSTLVTTGFVLGAIWCAIVINYVNTGEWHMPGTPAKTTRVETKPQPKAKPTQPGPKYSGTPYL